LEHGPQNLENVPFYVLHVRSQKKTFYRGGRTPQRRVGKFSIPYDLPLEADAVYFSWLHALFLGIDANFRLKRKNVSSDKADPDLNQGCAYFVEEKEYKEYLEVHKTDPIPVSCNVIFSFEWH
jgi:hypothetical protein